MVAGDRARTTRGVAAAKELREAELRRKTHRDTYRLSVPPKDRVSFEGQLTNLNSSSSGNFFLQVMVPAHEKGQTPALMAMMGWRLQITIKVVADAEG